MVVKIQPAVSSVRRAVEYNEQKVEAGVARVTFCSRIDDPTRVMDTFQRYENGAISAKNLSFHVSIDPSYDELKHMSADDVNAFVQEWMEKMGYGNQPYVVYEHNDNDRRHYHVVSVRVDEQGKKIDSWHEKIRSSKAVRELSSKYGIVLGKGSKSESKELKLDKKERIKGQDDVRPVPRFNPELGQAAKQLEAISKHALNYHFTSMNQYIALLRDMGVHASIEEPKIGKPRLMLSGIDPRTGKICTVRVHATRKVDIPQVSTIETHIANCKSQKRGKEKARVGNIAGFCLKHSKTKAHFDRMLAKKNMSVSYSFTKADKLFGATFIDHQTRCVFKCSELDAAKINLGAIDAMMTQTWPPFNHNETPLPMEQTSLWDSIDKDIDQTLSKLAELRLGDINTDNGEDLKRMQREQRPKRTIYG